MNASTEAEPAAGRPSLGRGMALVAVGNVFPPIAAFASMPLITHAVGVDGRGDVAAATAPYLLLSIGATFGMPEAMTFFTGRNPAALNRTLRRALAIVFVLGLVVSLGCCLLAGTLSDGRSDLTRLIILGTLAVTPALLVSVLRGCASGLQLWSRVAAEQVISSVIRLGGIAALAVAGRLTVTAVVLITVWGPIIGAVAYAGLRGRSGPAAAPGASVRPLLGFGARIWIGSIAGILLFRLDQTVMVPLASVYVLGLYAVAANISEVPLVINNAVRDVTFAAESAERMEDRLSSSARVSTAASGLVALVIGLSLPLWVPPVFGPAFAHAIPATLILLLGLWLGTPGSVAGAGLSGRGRPGLRTASLVVALVFNVSLLLLLTPVWGANGAALATLTGAAVAGWLNVFFLCRLSTLRVRDFVGLRRPDLAMIHGLIPTLGSGGAR